MGVSLDQTMPQPQFIDFFHRWVWTEAGSQPDLEQKLEVGGFGYPALAVLSSKKLKFSLMRGSFSTDGVNEYLRSV